MFQEIEKQLNQFEGTVGFYYKNLVDGKEFCFNAEKPFVAASVIKIPVMLETLLQIEQHVFSKSEPYIVKESDKVPSCGALTYMESGLQVTIKDLYTLMIILSDNTATNILIRKCGVENVNATLRKLGLTVTTLNRCLFEKDPILKQLSNYVAAKEIGILLEKIYNQTLGSIEISLEMERVLKLQRMNGKIPYLIEDKIEIAHKTGEDTNTTHDVGIVYAKTPFIVCFLSNHVNVLQYERFIQETSLALYKQHS